MEVPLWGASLVLYPQRCRFGGREGEADPHAASSDPLDLALVPGAAAGHGVCGRHGDRGSAPLPAVVLPLGEIRYLQREVAKSLWPRKEEEMTFFCGVFVCACAAALGRLTGACWGPPPGTALAVPARLPLSHPRCPRGRSALAAPSHQHVPEEAQRLLRRLRLVGAFPCPSLPPSLPGAVRAALLPSAAPEQSPGAVQSPNLRPCQHEHVAGGSDLHAPVPAGSLAQLQPSRTS